jgi:hypothetical protein
MATFPNSYVQIGMHTTARINEIVDNMMTPRLLNFRQITVYDEKATPMSPFTWKVSYPTWNPTFPVVVRLNSHIVTPSTVDAIMGSVSFAAAANDGDNVNVTYNIDWFPVGVLAGFIYQAIDIINNSGQAQSATHYTIADAPSNWDGVIADLAFAMAMEKLILDYDLWYGRLIFAIGANDLNEGQGGDVVGQLETLKQNAEERANISLNNEKFKIGNLLAAPTTTYYAAVRGIGRTSTAHGMPGGKIRGWRPNKYV